MRNDGSYLEEMVKSYFNTLKDPRIVLHRFNDSHSARNITSSQPSDFLVAIGGRGMLLECKSVKHDFRLKKFTQHPRMNRWALAGFSSKVLVHHYGVDVFRVINVEDLEIGKPSFNLRAFPSMSMVEALEAVFKEEA